MKSQPSVRVSLQYSSLVKGVVLCETGTVGAAAGFDGYVGLVGSVGLLGFAAGDGTDALDGAAELSVAGWSGLAGGLGRSGVGAEEGTQVGSRHACQHYTRPHAHSLTSAHLSLKATQTHRHIHKFYKSTQLQIFLYSQAEVNYVLRTD